MKKSRHTECWKSINKVTERRNPKRRKIKVIRKEDRVRKWHEHFKKLLGEGQEYETSSIQINTICESTLAIQTGPLTAKNISR